MLRKLPVWPKPQKPIDASASRALPCVLQVYDSLKFIYSNLTTN